MYHILIISENRILLKEVFEMIKDDSLYRIHIVPFSMDAYEVFYQKHADVVILDTSVFLSYENILEQFKQCQWRYHVILLNNGMQLSTPTSDNVLLINQEEWSKELFHEVLTNIVQHRNDSKKENTDVTIHWDGIQTFIIHPDIYHLIFVHNFDTNGETIADYRNRIIEEAIPYCQLKQVFYNSREVLFYISRSDIKNKFNITLLSQIIFKVLGQKAAIIYQENINWRKVYDICMLMKEHVNYCYFLQGELCNLLEDLVPQSQRPLREIKSQCAQFLQAMLNNDAFSGKHILQELYLHMIKAGIDFETREYIRMQLQFFCYLLTGRKMEFPYMSVEEELEEILKMEFLYHNSYSSDRIKETIQNTILTIYNLYDTDISLEGIANELSLNKIYLNRIFKEQFGVTILETLQILRLQYTKYLLIHSDKKVAQIAEEIGFRDTGYFSKFFRKATGCTALEFRLKREDEKEMTNRYEGFMAI